jgi:hypothetical protein
MEDARHLSKYIFPREYGLASVFFSATKAHKYSDFANREDELRVGIGHVPHYLSDLAVVEESSPFEDA